MCRSGGLMWKNNAKYFQNYVFTTKRKHPYTTFQLNIKYGFTWNKDKQVLC